MQIVPNDSKIEQLSSEVKQIKAWFDSNAHTSNLVNCTSGKKLQPRWDRSRDDGDRFEFDIFEDGKISLPKLSGTGLKSGRMKFISKKKNDNGNGNAVGQGVFVSYIPFQSFVGDITKISTTTFRPLKFDGLILFYESNGCLTNGYRIQKGIVMTKLEAGQSGQLSTRCGGGCWDYFSQYYTLVVGGGSCSTTASGTGPVTTICDPPCAVSSGSYDSGFGNTGNNSSGPTNDPIYNDYLTQMTIDAFQRLCQATFVFQTVQGENNGPNGNTTRLEAGMRNDGIRISIPGTTVPVSFGFNYTTFGVPLISPSFPNGITPAQASQLSSNAVNLAVTQIQQRAMMGTIATDAPTLSLNFWGQVNINMANQLGSPVSGTYTQQSNSAVYYITPNAVNPQLTIIYNVPITGPLCN